MSVDLIVYLKHSAMPTPTGWQKAIHDAGFPIEIDTDIDSDTFSGFLPCKYRGALSGFEYYANRMSEAESAEVGAPPGANFSITLVTHSDLREFSCSAVAAAMLAKCSGGLLFDPQSGESITSEDAVNWAKEQLLDAER